MPESDYIKLMEQGEAAMLEEYFSTSSDMFATFDTNGTFVRVNAAWTAVLGYPPSELVGRAFLTFVHPHDVARTLEAFDTANTSGERVSRFENRYRHRDGSYRWLEWIGGKVPDGTAHYSAARDITERKQREESVGAGTDPG